MTQFDNSDLLQKLATERVSLEQLYLNPNNPRIMGSNRIKNVNDNRIKETSIQKSVLADLKGEGLNDIIEKVKKVGFLPVDRVVVRKIENEIDKYVVLEGNRRISSLKILLEEHNNGIETIEEQILSSIKNFEVLIYEGSDDHIEWLLQGLRHINGIKQWGALQQARFLFEMQEKRNMNSTELNKMTALGRNSIANMIRSYRGWLFTQNIIDNIEDEHYSLFQEAIFKKPIIRDWLEWSDESGFKNEENLEQLVTWYLGNDSITPKIKRVVDIRDYLPQLLSTENREVFSRFINDDSYSFEEAQTAIQTKNTEKTIQNNQLDMDQRIDELKRLYISINTLPIPLILQDENVRSEVKRQLSSIETIIKTISSILSK